MQSISTQSGKIELLPLSEEVIGLLAKLSPFEIVIEESEQFEKEYGLVMKHGDSDVYCIKHQPPDCSKEYVDQQTQANCYLINNSIPAYLEKGFSGCLMPCAYIRNKDENSVECGIAYFGQPSSDGLESKNDDFNLGYYDKYFGKGFFNMVKEFLICLSVNSKETGVPLFTSIGLDIRAREHLEGLILEFMIVGNHVICLKKNITEEDSAWSLLAQSGIHQVYHMPSKSAWI